MRPALALSLVFVVKLAQPADAHEFWIETAPTAPPPGSPYAVALRVGDGLADAHPVRRDDRRIRRFVTAGATGERDVLGVAGSDPAGLARAGAAPGVEIVVYESDHARIELAAERFESYRRSDGLETIAAQRAARGATSEPGRERYARCAKSLVRIASEATTTTADRAVGLPLELVAMRAPWTLGDDALPVRLLFEGRPLAGALVTARRLVEGREQTVSARTGGDGEAMLPLGAPAFWLIGAVHMITAPPGGDADWTSWWASLTFDNRSTPRR